MAISKNEHTGDALKSKAQTDDYRNNYDRIFRRDMKFIVTAITPDDTEIVLDAGDDVILNSLKQAEQMSEAHRLSGDTNTHVIYKLEKLSAR